ncbi:MAG: cell division protein FtsQ/DivIB [Acidimicrobiia bacterium]
MKTVMDPRIADRRRGVSEDGARRRLRWGIAIILMAGFVGLVAYAFQSPLLSVRRVMISGSERADVAAVLRLHGVEPGVPTIRVRASVLETAIESDPWVTRASVIVTWPGEVEVTVLEHVPSAWMRLPNGWMLVSATGAILEKGRPPDGAPRVQIGLPTARPGDKVLNPAALAALEFLAGLPTGFVEGAVVAASGPGLVATIAGHEVDLGGAHDMPAKASTLSALLEEGLMPGAAVSLLSADRPAVSNPRPEVEPTEVTSTDASG